MRDRLRKVVFSVFVLWAVLLLETQPRTGSGSVL